MAMEALLKISKALSVTSLALIGFACNTPVLFESQQEQKQGAGVNQRSIFDSATMDEPPLPHIQLPPQPGDPTPPLQLPPGLQVDPFAPGAPPPLPPPQFTPPPVVVGQYCAALYTQSATLSRSNSRSDAPSGSILEDIVQHLPASFQGRSLGYGNTYYSTDPITWAHETMHGLSAHIRNYFAPAPLRTVNERTGFYFGQDRILVLPNPKITLQQASSFVPASLRERRYQLYFVMQQSSWNQRPLMIMDEWSAYNMGAEAGIDLYNRGRLPNYGANGSNENRMNAPLEFTFYGFSVAYATGQKDPTFLANETFRNVIGCLAERGIAAHRVGKNIPGFNFRIDVEQAFKTSADAENLRNFIKSYLTESWYQRYF